MILPRLAIAAALVLAASAASAENAPVAVARATVESIAPDGATLKVKTRGGEEATVRLDAKTRFVLVVPSSLATMKPGAFIGVAAVPGDGETLKALEVHVFPESMRGTGEGFRPFDLGPRSTMTNGAVAARVDGVQGQTLTVSYKGGQQTIVVPPGTPIVGFDPGARGDLKPGAAIIARGHKAEDGSLDAAYVLIGKDGLVPPM